jgi:DNA polymerase-3 subunit epsilon
MWENGIRPFIGDLHLTAHSARFDMGVLSAALEWYGLPVPHYRYFCSLALAQIAFPFLNQPGKHFKIVYQAHNALADAETCGKIVIMAADQLGTQKMNVLLAKARIGKS